MIVRLYNAFPSLLEFESEQENSVAKVFWFVLLPGNGCDFYYSSQWFFYDLLKAWLFANVDDKY